jgi:heptosyltransferase II
MISGPVSRLIVRAPNWLGDAVMALPALAAVRRAFEARTLVLAAPGPVAAIFAERTPAAPDEILTIDRDRELEQLRAARGDALLLLTNSFGSAWIARRSGIPERWGYRAAGRGFLLTRGVPRPKGKVHQIEYYLALARGLGIAVPELAEARPELQPTPAASARADTLLAAAGVDPAATIVGFAPGAAYGQAKRWPPNRVAQVIAALANAGVTSVLVGARDDRPAARAIESTLPPGTRVVDLIGRTSVRELIGVVARCAAFVSNDSGAMHVAAALGVPLTAIFGPTDERATAPAGNADVIRRDVFCRPCMLRDCPIDHRCMKRIDVESVLTSVTAHLRSGRPPSLALRRPGRA